MNLHRPSLAGRIASERPCAAHIATVSDPRHAASPPALRGCLSSCQHSIEHMVAIIHLELKVKIWFDVAIGG